MANAQKTSMIPKVLKKVLAEREKTTGVPYSRQLRAALFHYLAADERLQSLWLRAAVAHELGELKIADMPDFVRDNFSTTPVERS